MAMLEESHAASGGVNEWAVIVGALAVRLRIMFHCHFLSEHTVYPTAVNKTLQSYFLLRVRESWWSRELGLSHSKYRLTVHEDKRERKRETEGERLCSTKISLATKKTLYSHIIHGQFVPTPTFC